MPAWPAVGTYLGRNLGRGLSSTSVTLGCAPVGGSALAWAKDILFTEKKREHEDFGEKKETSQPRLGLQDLEETSECSCSHLGKQNAATRKQTVKHHPLSLKTVDISAGCTDSTNSL